MLSEIVVRMQLHSGSLKTLLIPSGVNPGLVKRSLALKAGGVANLTVKSRTGYFVELAAPHFPRKTFLAGDRQFFLLASLLKSIKPTLTYFTESIEFEGVIALMIATLRELRLNE